MAYVDGFVFVVPKKNFTKYKKMASDAGKVWKKHGALHYFECIGDDMNPNMPGTKSLTFPKMTKVKPGENVWYSFIIFKSKSHRDTVNKKVMAYYSKKYNDPDCAKDMPFDMKKMAYGGFQSVVSL